MRVQQLEPDEHAAPAAVHIEAVLLSPAQLQLPHVFLQQPQRSLISTCCRCCAPKVALGSCAARCSAAALAARRQLQLSCCGCVGCTRYPCHLQSTSRNSRQCSESGLARSAAKSRCNACILLPGCAVMQVCSSADVGMQFKACSTERAAGQNPSVPGTVAPIGSRGAHCREPISPSWSTLLSSIYCC